MNELTGIILPPAAPISGPVGVRSVDVTRGESRGDVSAQWATRPADQRYLSLTALLDMTRARRDSSFEETIMPRDMMARGSETDKNLLSILTSTGRQLQPTHHSFGQLASLTGIGKATEVLRSQPAFLAGLNLTWALRRGAREETVKLYGGNTDMTLRAATGEKYGRIFDASLVEAIHEFAGDGTGDSHWKIPGVIDWSKHTYNPYVDITTENTTLYASDRDVFVFLVDDTRPIEIGTLPNGDPDLIFRGFYSWNSEVGTRSLGIATFWLRGICQNRNLWGVEDFEDLRIIHTRYGADRFAREAAPALQRYADSEPTKLLAGISAAREAKVAEDKDEGLKFLTADSLGFSLRDAERILGICEMEEGHPANTVWDMTQGITAFARTLPHQDKRLEVEKVASKLMDRAARSAI